MLSINIWAWVDNNREVKMSWIRKLLIIAVVILVAFLTAFFVFKNPAPVSINFIVVDVAGYSIAMWLVLSFLLVLCWVC